MARIVLHTIYPFRKGTDRMISEGHYLTIEMETAPKKAGLYPFEIVEYLPNLEPFVNRDCRFTLVTDACAELPNQVRLFTELRSDYIPR